MPHLLKVTMERDLSEQFFYDVMCVCVESNAITYWARIFHVNRLDTLDITEFMIAERETSFEGVTAGDERWVIDSEQIAAGIQMILDGKVLVADYIRDYIVRAVTEADAGDIDSVAADCIVQAVVFEELVYG